MPIPIVINTEELQRGLADIARMYGAVPGRQITRRVLAAALRPIRREYLDVLPAGARGSIRRSNILSRVGRSGRSGLAGGGHLGLRGTIQTRDTGFVVNFLSGTVPRFTGGRTTRRGTFNARAGATRAFRGAIPRLSPTLEEQAVSNAGTAPLDAAFRVYNELVQDFPIRGR